MAQPIEFSDKMLETFGNLVSILIASVLLIILGLVYFMINLWIVTTGAGMLGVTPEMPVLSAVLLTFAGIVASALSQKR